MPSDAPGDMFPLSYNRIIPFLFGGILLLWGLTAQAQTVTVNPASTTICMGRAMSLSATTTGFILAPSIQWRVSPQTPLSNTTGVSTTFQAPAVSVPTTFTIITSVSGFTATGAIRSLTTTSTVRVNPPVGITTQPTGNSVVCVGGTVTVVMSASGGINTVQWFKKAANGTLAAIGGPTANTLTLTNVTPAQSGSYVAVLFGTCNILTSSAFSLSVTDPPSLTINAGEQVCVGSSASLTAIGCTGGTVHWPGGVTGTVFSTSVAGVYTATCITPTCPVAATAQGNILLTQAPARLFVNASQTAVVGDGLSWQTAFRDLQQALTYPCRGNLTEIWVARGVYKPTGNNDRTVGFRMLPNVRMYGGFVGTETALSQRPPVNPTASTPSNTTLSGEIGDLGTTADNSFHVIYNNIFSTQLTVLENALLDGFVVADGNANGAFPDDRGGGMINIQSRPTVINCLFLNNEGINAGALYNNETNQSFTNCLFENNRAVGLSTVFNSGFGGAVLNVGAIVRFTNTIFRNNGAVSGGAIANQVSNLTITAGSFQNNESSRAGGAVYNEAARTVFQSCSFRQNKAVSGGGFYNTRNGNNPILTNCVFQSNSATQGAGILSAGSGNPTLTNCTFADNQASSGGGAIGVDVNSTLNATNCVFWNNGGNSGSLNSAFNNIGTLSITFSLFDLPSFISTPGNLTTITSPFAGTSTLQLSGCSAAINAANSAAYATANGGVPPSLTTDHAGNPRLFDSLLDMGAFEFQGIGGSAIVMNQPPENTTLCPGSTLTTSLSAAGATTYQWLLNGVAVCGQTSATLTVPNVTTAQAGAYRVVVSGACETIASNALNVVVSSAAPGGCPVVSVKAGNWNDATVWNVARLPEPGERVTLRHAITMPVSFKTSVFQLAYDSGGKIIFDSGSWLRVGQ
ncbi:MAG: hypothetical protein EAZ91_01070 [Cytophagales bacterium]|nr:MAG: hypothetical protein EAZ91_01070 [Cytophagales bacterium]